MSFTSEDAIQILCGNQSGIGRERFDASVPSPNLLSPEEALRMFPDVKLSKSNSVVYFPMKMCHSLPSRNQKGRCFTPKTLANSHATAKDVLVDIDHELVDNGTAPRDNICGHIVATAFDKDFQWKEAVSQESIPASPIPLYALGVLYQRHRDVPRILKEYATGETKWQVSMECGHKWTESHILHGDEFIPFLDAPGPILEQISRHGANRYRDKELAIALGGVDGHVDFWGLALTADPADKDAQILSFVSGMSGCAASVGHPKFLSEIKSSIFPGNSPVELSGTVTDSFFSELASIESIGSTGSAEDGHVHDVLSDGTILPHNGHVHYLEVFHLKKGSSPSLTGRTSTHYRYEEPGGEVVHVHLLNISLKGKAKKVDTDLSSMSIGSLANGSLANSEREGQMALSEELLKRIEALEGKGAGEIASEIADLKSVVQKSIHEDEFGKAVAAAVTEEIENKGLVSKEDADKQATEAVEAEQKKATEEKEKEDKIAQRIQDIKDLGVKLDDKLGEGEEAKTIEQAIRDIPAEDDGTYNLTLTLIKQVAEAKKLSEETVSSAASKNSADSAPVVSVIPVVGGGPTEREQASEESGKSTGRKIGKAALTVV